MAAGAGGTTRRRSSPRYAATCGSSSAACRRRSCRSTTATSTSVGWGGSSSSPPTGPASPASPATLPPWPTSASIATPSNGSSGATPSPSTPWGTRPPPGRNQPARGKFRSMRPGRDAPPNMTDYEAERAAFRLDVPPRFNFVLDVLERRAAATHDGLALLGLGADGAETARYSWAEMARETRRMGNALLRQGAQKGDPSF